MTTELGQARAITAAAQKAVYYGKKCAIDGCGHDCLRTSPFCVYHSEETPKPARVSQVYFIVADDSNIMKIGTSTNVGVRFEALQSSSPLRLALVSMFYGDHSLECRIHKALKDYRSHGEWFRIEGKAKELLEIARTKGRLEVMQYMKENCFS